MRTLRSLFIWGGVILLFQIAFAWVMYEAEYADIISVRRYQSLEDVAHNKTTIATNRCLLAAGANYLDNWNRICKAYGLGEGCGLPKADYARLTDGLKNDNESCQQG